MTTLARRVAESHGFQNFILGVILVTAVIVGVETSDPLMARYGGLFEVADMVVQTIFVLEIVIRLLAHWPRLGRFFRDGWNLFDLAGDRVPPAPGRRIRDGRPARPAPAGDPPRLGLPGAAAHRHHHAPVHPVHGTHLDDAGPAALRVRRARLLPLPRARSRALGHARRRSADPVPDAHAGGVGRGPGCGARSISVRLGVLRKLRCRGGVRGGEPVHRGRAQQSRDGQAWRSSSGKTARVRTTACSRRSRT